MMLNVQAVRDWGKLCGDHQNFPGLPSRLTSWDGGQLCRDHKNLPGLPTGIWHPEIGVNYAKTLKISVGFSTGLTFWDGAWGATVTVRRSWKYPSLGSLPDWPPEMGGQLYGDHQNFTGLPSDWPTDLQGWGSTVRRSSKFPWASDQTDFLQFYHLSKKAI